MRTIKILGPLAVAIFLFGALGAPKALAAFGVAPGGFDGGNFSADGGSFTQAAGHPYESSVQLEINTVPSPTYGVYPDGGTVKDIIVKQPPGLGGDPSVMSKCGNVADLLGTAGISTECPLRSQIGFAEIELLTLGAEPVVTAYSAIFNMEPLRGAAATLGFLVFGNQPVLVNIDVRNDGGLTFSSLNTSQGGIILRADIAIWGVPADSSHDSQRCLSPFLWAECPGPPGDPLRGSNPAGMVPKAFLRMPTHCTKPGEGDLVTADLRSWDPASAPAGASFETHLTPGFPLDPAEWGPPQGMAACEAVPFAPDISIKPTTDQAETPTGLDVELTMPQTHSPESLAQADVKRAVVELPEGMTLNPSAAEGLGACTPADLARETSASAPGAGCPNQSKIGTVAVETTALAEPLSGNLYIAQQDDPATATSGAENPFDSLLAFYIVLKSKERGVNITLPGRIEPDARTGRLVASVDDGPQVPFDRFVLHFREGSRAPLVTPATCGTYTTEVAFTPWAAADPDHPEPSEVVHDQTSFRITRGVGGSPCPPGGVPPFRPGFSAGSINNNAAAHTDFNMRVIRRDGEQDMTRFSAILPPGVLGKLAGIDKCPDAVIAVAKSKTGRQEIASPSCPANSEIGHSLVGAGVGSILTYVPGKIYLGGPVKGDPLSVIAITPVVAGPFDVGTVVVREALTLNPKTAEAEVDGAASDPIPHILKGIPAKLRDLRVYVDRDKFIINPTNCEGSSAKATLFGSFLDVIDPSDDRPVSLSDRFQAANCAALGFKPKLALNLKGGTRRGGHPGLIANYRPRNGDANVKGLVVRLPRSAFLDQAHIRTICTRVQFAADACPPAAQYGYIRAWTPLLEEPLQGPVWLRSSNHKLPDLVFDLHGLVDVEVATRIDSARGGIRATVESAPDAPLTKVELRMQGGKKGLIVNSRNLCAATSKAAVDFTGQNGKQSSARPVMRADCGGGRAHKRHPR